MDIPQQGKIVTYVGRDLIKRAALITKVHRTAEGLAQVNQGVDLVIFGLLGLDSHLASAEVNVPYCDTDGNEAMHSWR